MTKKYLWILFYFLSPIIPIIAIFNSNTSMYSDFTNFVAMATGTVGFVWLVYEFVLSSRPVFIERYFGMDKFYRFHGLMAIVSLILVFIHQAIIYDAPAAEYGSAAFNIFIAASVLALIFMANTIILKIKPIMLLRKALEKYSLFKYNKQVLIHNAMAVAYVIMFIHVMATGVAQDSTMVRSIFIIYFAVGSIFYIYHKFIRPALLRKNMFKVKDVVKESDNMWTINLVPQNGRIISYKPGQFGFLKLFGKNIRSEEHPFSISSSPTNNQYISFTIKELGDYTSNIGKVEVGNLACIDGPYGKFSYLEYEHEKYTILIAGGVGITPMLSMLRYMNDKDTNHNVILLWGVNTKSDLICKYELENIQKRMKNLNIVPVMAKDDSWQGEKGYINSQLIQKILSKYQYNMIETGFYICGPGPMSEAVVKGLKLLNVKRKYIHYEKFSM